MQRALEDGSLRDEPQVQLRLFAIERRQDPDDPGSALGRDLGVVLWSGDGTAMFRRLLDPGQDPALAGDRRFPFLQRMRPPGLEVRYERKEVHQLLSEVGAIADQHEEVSRVRFALSVIEFACDEAIRTESDLLVRDAALDTADVQDPMGDARSSP